MTPDCPKTRWVDAPIPFSAIARLFLGGYFLHAGINKALDPVVFLKSIHLYQVLPEQPAFLLNGTAVMLPWIEIVCGAALILGLWRRGAALNIAVMLLVFTPAILLRGLEIHAAQGGSFFDVKFDCGCGTGVEITWIKLCKNIGLFVLAIMTLLAQSRWLAIDALMTRPHTKPANRCRRCGEPVAEAGATVCAKCAETPVPAAAPDTAS